ncbi:MAG: hypothetical protein ABSA66_05520 [Roseiarcus sp.]
MNDSFQRHRLLQVQVFGQFPGGVNDNLNGEERAALGFDARPPETLAHKPTTMSGAPLVAGMKNASDVHPLTALPVK